MDHEDRNAGATGRPGRRTWALMALVAVITAVAVWLVPVDDADVPTALPELPPAPGRADAPQPPGAGAGLSGSPDTAAGAAAPAAGTETRSLELPLPPGGVATVTGGGEAARTFLYKLKAAGAEPDPEVVFAEAERLQGSGQREDAYLLYRYAARHGQAQAAMTLGTAADPAYHASANAFLPDPAPGQARKWYSIAAAAGDEEAGRRLEDLRVRLERDAADGDEQAARLLLQWR